MQELHMVHYYTYLKTPKMNAHLERFNRTIQEEFINYHSFLLLELDSFNRKLADYLILYNTERVHCAFKNKLSPIQFMISIGENHHLFKMPLESKNGLHYTYTVKKYAYLKNGSMYSVGFLGIIMVIEGFGLYVYSWMPPLITFLVVGLFFIFVGKRIENRKSDFIELSGHAP